MADSALVRAFVSEASGPLSAPRHGRSVGGATSSIEAWATGSREPEKRTRGLPMMWPSPRASDATGGKIAPAGTTPTGMKSDGSKTQIGINHAATRWPHVGNRSKGSVSVAWIEQLMGFNRGWTRLEGRSGE